MTTDGTSQPPQRMGMAGLRSAYRILIHRCELHPHRTPVEIGVESGFDAIEVLDRLGITPERFVADIAAHRRFMTLTKLLVLRGRGQIERHRTLERLKRRLVKSWAWPDAKQDRLADRIDVEQSAFDEYARLRDVRRRHCLANGHIYLKMNEDGSLGSELFDGLE